MAQEKLYTHEEVLDKVLGKQGTTARDQYEADIHSFLMGETIRKARRSRNLTQDQLGELSIKDRGWPQSDFCHHCTGI